MHSMRNIPVSPRLELLRFPKILIIFLFSFLNIYKYLNIVKQLLPTYSPLHMIKLECSLPTYLVLRFKDTKLLIKTSIKGNIENLAE